MSANRAPPAVAPADGGGSAEPPEGPVEPDCPERPPAAPGLAVRSRALEAPRQLARGGGLTRRRRRCSGCVNNSNLDAPHLIATFTIALRRERAAGVVAVSRPLRSRERLSSRDAPNFQANKPTFQRTSTRASRRFPSLTGFHPRGPASVALHDASLASDHQSLRGESAFCSDSAREQAFL
jgi:hypothetical protein